jgi:N-ethylmaleimide reductase
MTLLYSPTFLASSLPLRNRVVMSPMTRNRAIANVPNELMAEYYAQRASVGLIITEGTSPSPNGLGYPRIPGCFSQAQVDAWARVVGDVHARGAQIFIQLMHCGRIAHPLNLPAGARIVAPSAIAAAGEMYTDAEGMKPFPKPAAMNDEDIAIAAEEYIAASKHAMRAGFDGVELHGANGYLLEQFIRPNSNQRTDRYGGSIENRARFVLDVVEGVVKAIGRDKVGIRLSPFGVFNDMPNYPEMTTDYQYLARQLNDRELAYVHLVDHSSMGAPPVPASIKTTFRDTFTRSLILSGGYDAARAEQDLTDKKADLIAVGRPVLANPDLIARWKKGSSLNQPDMATFYTPGPQGYTDYPAMK